MKNIDEALDTVLDEVFDEIFDENYTATDFLLEVLTEFEERLANKNEENN